MGENIAEIPVGAPGFIAQWQLFNDGVSSWAPELNLNLPDSTWQGVCDPVSELASSGAATISCIITAPPFAMAGWQPEIGLTISADGVEKTASAFMTVASFPNVQWRTLSIEESVEGKASLVHFEVTNMGNTAIDERVIIETPSGWSAEIQESSLIDIGIDETQALRVLVTPGSSGEESVALSFENSEIPGSQHSVSLDVARDPTRSTDSSTATTIAIVLLLAFIVAGLVFAGLLIMRLREDNSTQKPAMNAPPPAAFNTPKSSSGIVCWGCNQPISGVRRACPSCGARYHLSEFGCSASTLTVCRNCQASVSTFVEEVNM